MRGTGSVQSPACIDCFREEWASFTPASSPSSQHNSSSWTARQTPPPPPTPCFPSTLPESLSAKPGRRREPTALTWSSLLARLTEQGALGPKYCCSRDTQSLAWPTFFSGALGLWGFGAVHSFPLSEYSWGGSTMGMENVLGYSSTQVDVTSPDTGRWWGCRATRGSALC